MQFDPKTRKRIALSEVERRQQYLDELQGEAEVLRPLVMECLDDDPAVRPIIAAVCESIQVSKDSYIKEFTQDVITLHEKVEHLKSENMQKDKTIDTKDRQIDLLKQQLVSVIAFVNNYHCHSCS